MLMAELLEIPDAWRRLAEAIERAAGDAPALPHTIYVLGDTDTGKSTLCRYLVDALAAHGPAALLDADPGQSTLGPPMTLGMKVVRPDEAQSAVPALRFVGSVTPVGHLLQTVTGAKRLAERGAEERATWLIVDSPGLVTGERGREFQHQMIDLLGPRWLIVLGEGETVEAITSVFDARGRPRVHRLAVAEAVKARSANRRATYRTQRFEAYFAEAQRRELTLAKRGLHGHLPRCSHPEEAVGRVVALCDREGFVVTLGIVEAVDWSAGVLQLFAPPFDETAVTSVQFGTSFR